METSKLKNADRQALRRAAYQQVRFIEQRLYEHTLQQLEAKAAEVGVQAALQPDVLEAVVERAVQSLVAPL